MNNANLQRIADLEKCFTTPTKLHTSNTILIGEGDVSKVCRKEQQLRRIMLFNDKLVIAAYQTGSDRKLRTPHIFSLHEVTVSDETAFPYAFQIKTPRKSFSLIATSQEDKKKWTTHISRQVSEAKDRMGGHLVPSEHAAVWVSDTKTNRCMHCFNYEFSLIKRKHHCRKCGIVVCGPCSTHKLLIENISKSTSRVCDSCYFQSMKGTNKSIPISSNTSHKNDEESYSDEEEYQSDGKQMF